MTRMVERLLAQGYGDVPQRFTFTLRYLLQEGSACNARLIS
jgi:hypothetical protein